MVAYFITDASWHVNSGRTFLNNAWWVSVFPGIGVFLAIMSINMLGEGLNQILDPVNQ